MTSWDQLAALLREEIEHHGALLGLFAQQEDHLIRPNPAAVLDLALQIEDAARLAQRLRGQREVLVRDVATAAGQPEDITLRRLIGHGPAAQQPLFEALFAEVNRLIHRTRRQARLNHELLQRTLEIHRDTLRALRPDAYPTTYDTRGTVAFATGSTLRAAG